MARDGQGRASQLHGLGARAEVVACDSADGDEDRNVLLSAGSPTGLLHTAGVGDRGLLAELEAQRVQWMHGSKAVGLWRLSFLGQRDHVMKQ